MVKRITKNDKKNMKRLFSVMMFAALMFTSCGKDAYHYKDLTPGYGTLSFEGAELTVSEEVETRASVAPDNYMIWVKDSAGNYIDLDTASEKVVYTTYGAVKEDGITLPAGDYTLEVQSAAEIPDAILESDAAIYGAEREFKIVAGLDTNISSDENGGPIVCTLWKQVKVSVGYNDYFKEKCVSGSAVVTVGDVSMQYPMTHTEAGFFAVEKDKETSIEVTFSGVMKVKEDGVETQKTQKMTHIITGVKARQWRKITFILTEDKEGNATFSIDIDGYVVDAELSETVDGSGVETESNGADPNAPQGDGGIELVSTCSYDITQPIEIPAMSDPTDASTMNMTLTMQANVPNGVRKFGVVISSDSEAFQAALNVVSEYDETAGGYVVDLVNPTEKNNNIFGIIPFPHGSELVGLEEVDFDLSAAQMPILAFPGTHTFVMNVTDQKGCKKDVTIVMYVPDYANL